MITDKEIVSTIEQEAELYLDEFDEDAADAELQRIMRFYAGVIEGELEWNLTSVNL